MRSLFFLLPFIATPFVAQSQQDPESTAPAPKEIRHLLKLVPQEFIVNTFRVDYEFKTGKRSSLQLSPSLTSAENSMDYDEVTGGGADATAKFYLRDESESLKGFYGGLNASFHKFSIHDSFSRSGPNATADSKHSVTRIGGNLVLGYQFIFQRVVAVDLYVGGGIRASRTKEETDPFHTFGFPDPRYSGIAPKAGFSIGMVL